MLIKSAEDTSQDGFVTHRHNRLATDLRGLVRLSTDAVHLTTELVEAQHSRLDWISNWIFPPRKVEDKVRNPIAALVYNSIYTINSIVGTSLEWTIMSLLEPVLSLSAGRCQDDSKSTAIPRRRQAALAILNGVVGDYLVDTGNPLAVLPQWRTEQGLGIRSDDGVALQQWVKRQFSDDHQPRHLLILIHGACNSPDEWWQNGRSHGVELTKEFEGTMMEPLYWHYNTGLHLSENGQILAHALDRLVRAVNNDNSQPPLSISIVAHSMGGLVARSACHYAQEYNNNEDPQALYSPMVWLEENLRNLVCLGSPHHGALLERGGKLVDALLGAHRFTEPISWLGKIRSNGVTDLGYGNIREEDWIQAKGGMGDHRLPTPLPKHVRCCAIAAVTGDANASRNRLLALRGDGLVTQDSALGQGHANPDMNLKWTHHATVFNVGHIGLLSSLEVYQEIRACLCPTAS